MTAFGRKRTRDRAVHVLFCQADIAILDFVADVTE